MRERKVRQERFDFEKMKAAATHADPAVRKKAFIDYFERFEEFPSYLFDNEAKMDSRLSETMRDISRDPEASPAMLKGVEALKQRLFIDRSGFAS